MSTLIFACAKPTPKPTAPKQTKLTSIKRSNDYLSVAERVNGRAAMIGFTSAATLSLLPVWRSSEQRRILTMRDTFRASGNPRRSL